MDPYTGPPRRSGRRAVPPETTGSGDPDRSEAVTRGSYSVLKRNGGDWKIGDVVRGYEVD